MDKHELEALLTSNDRRLIFEDLGVNLHDETPDGRGWIQRLYLPDSIHKDTSPDFSVNLETGAINDFGGEIEGDMYTLVMEVLDTGFREALEWVECRLFERFLLDQKYDDCNNMALESIPNDDIKAFAGRLLKSDEEVPRKLRGYLGDRMINLESIKKHKLGIRNWKGGWWLFIPFKAEGNECQNYKMVKFCPEREGWDLDQDGKKDVLTSGDAQLYPIHTVESARYVLLCEGELDAIVAQQIGLNALTTTGGSGFFSDEIAQKIKKYADIVYVAYDGDKPGRKGAKKAARILARRGFKTLIADVPEGEDVNSLTIEYGLDAQSEFKKLLSNSEVYEYEQKDKQELTEMFEPKRSLLWIKAKFHQFDRKQQSEIIRLINAVASEAGYSLNKL